MREIEWNEIERPLPWPLMDEAQWLEIVRVRFYVNYNFRHCIELSLEAENGFIIRKCFPRYPMCHVLHFVRDFMGLNMRDLIRKGGLTQLVGDAFYAYVDFTSEPFFQIYPAL